MVKISNAAENFSGQRLIPWLQKLVDQLTSSSKFNDYKAIVTDLESSAPTYVLLTEGMIKCDRFTVGVPYAQDTLKWPMSFCWSNPEIPPIIGFDDEDFIPNYGALNGLKMWDSNNPNALLDLIVELLAMYKQFQISICNENERLAMEIENLKNYDQSKMDILLDSNDIVFVFTLVVDGVLDLPKIYIEDAIIDNRVILKVKYKNFGAGTATAELMLCSFLNRLLSGKYNSKLPPFECFLNEYVERIQQILNENVRDLKEVYEYRKNVVTACSQIFNFPLDGDFVYFTKATYLIEETDFKCVFQIKIPNNWPPVGIELTIASVYIDQKQLDSPTTDKIFWKPAIADKTNEQLKQELRETVEDMVQKFKKNTLESACV